MSWLLALFMAITPIFCCGAECGIVSAGAAGGVLHWTTVTGAPTAETTGAINNGARCYRFTTAAGARVSLNKTLASPGIVVSRLYVYFETSLPSADCKFYTAASTDALADCTITFKQADSKIYARVGGSNGATGVLVTTNTWYLIDCKAVFNAATRTMDVQVNGTACGQASGAFAASTCSGVRFGINTDTTTANGTTRIDDMIVSTTSADYPIGAGKCVGLSPAADGTHNFNLAGDFKYTNTTNVAVGATDTWTHVDTLPLTQIADFLAVVGAANTEYLEWKFGSTGSDVSVINGLEVVSSHHSASTSANKETMRLNDGGTTNDVFTDTDFSNTTISYNSKHYATAPTGGAWTKAKVDALRVRWNSSFGTVDESPVPFIDGVLFEVDYVPSSTSPSATDTLTLAESAAVVSPQSQSDTETVTESWAATLIATATDVLSLGESASASQGAGSQIGTGADAAALAESATIVAPVSAVDSAAVAESPSVVLPTIAVDTASLAESARAVLTFAVADTLAVAEAFTSTLAVSISDGPAVGESASATQGSGSQVASTADTLTVADSVVAQLGASATDTSALSEAASNTADVSAADTPLVSEFGQGISGQQMNGQALVADITFTARLAASETTIAQAVGTESLT